MVAEDDGAVVGFAAADVSARVLHIPDVFKFAGVVSARRYRATAPEDRFQYVTVYEFESEETLQRFLASDHFAFLRKEYDRNFGGVSERQRASYVQVWP